MDIKDALEQIEAIHGHLARAEVYRGFRARAIALVGMLAFMAALAQPWIVPGGAEREFVAYWLTVAVVAALMGAGTILRVYLVSGDDLERRQTRVVAAQFLPSLAAGAVVTVCLLRAGPAAVACLPGLWAMLFGLGMVAACPYLPRHVATVAYFYMGCGALLLARAASAPVLSSWSVGIPFGVGHLLTALVLHLDSESENA